MKECKKMKKIFGLIVSLCMLVSLVAPVTYAEETAIIAGGYWGVAENGQGTGNADLAAVPEDIVRDNYKWTIDSNGVFTFEAVSEDADEIGNQQNPDNNPWKDYKGQITKVIIPEGVVQVGGRLFEWYNTGLTEAVLPESCEVLMGAFVGCQQLTKINIPKNIKELKLGHTGIGGSVNLPETVETVRTEDFIGTGISELTVNGSDIQANAFMNCQGMKTINIFGDSIVDNYAFHNNVQISKIVIGPGVTFNKYAIAAHTEKVDGVYPETAELPGNVVYATVYGVSGTSAEEYADFHNLKFVPMDDIGSCGELSYNVTDNILTISGEGEIPDYETGKAPWYAVADEIRTIKIESGATSIGANAFYGLSNVKNAIIPNGVVSIGAGAFALCDKLAAVVIPDSVTSIGADAFSTATAACVGINSAYANTDGYKTYTDGVAGDTALNPTGSVNWAVYGGDTLVISGSEYLVNSEPESYSWAEYATGLKTMIVDYGITSLPNYLFGYKEGVIEYAAAQTVVIADTVTNISHNLIAGAYNISRLDLSGKSKSIAHYVTGDRKGFANLKTLVIPKTLKWTSASLALNNLTGLENLIFEDGFNGFECTNSSNCWTAFIRQTGDDLKSITIPASITNIPAYTFTEIWGLERIEVLNPETTINENAFSNCNNANVTVVCAVGSQAEAYAKAQGMKTETYIGQGTLENGVTWIINDEGVLKLSGNGSTGDYTVENPAPWASVADEITSIKVENGITAIGAYAFANLVNATEATIAKSVTEIGENAFQNHNENLGILCESDAVKAYAEANGINVIIGGTLSSGVMWKIDGDTLRVYGEGEIPGDIWSANTTERPWKEVTGYASNIKKIIVDEGITKISGYAFAEAFAVETVVLPSSLTTISNGMFHKGYSLEFIEIPENTSNADGVVSPGALERAVILSKSFSSVHNIQGDNYSEDYTVYCYADSPAYTKAVEKGLNVETIKATGSDGNISWVVTNEGTLEIYGLGDLAELTSAPWSEYAADIEKIFIEEGITGVGTGLFAGIDGAYIELPDSVTALSVNAITATNSTVRVPVYVKAIAEGAFDASTTIYSYKNAYALEYAKANSLNYDERESLRILAVGNSYTQDSTMYLWNIANDLGAEDVIVGRMFHAGARLYEHWRAAQKLEGYEDYYLYTEQTSDDGEVAIEGVSLEYGVTAQDWDIIVLQAWYPEACYGLNGGIVDGSDVADEEWLDLLTNYFKETATNENVELGFNMIWSQERQLSEETPNDTANGNNNRFNEGDTIGDWEYIMSQTNAFVASNSDYKYVIPVGTAIENARTSYLAGLRGATSASDMKGGLQRDAVHLNDIGKYIAGMTWAKTLKPEWNVEDIDFIPDVTYSATSDKIIDAHIQMTAKEAVKNAVADWDTVTTSKYPYRIMKYENDNVTVAVSNAVRNVWGEDRSVSAKLIFAEYTTDDKLVKALPVDAVLTYDEVIDGQSTQLNNQYMKNIFPDNGFTTSEGNVVKVMLWDGLTGLTPLCDAFIK